MPFFLYVFKIFFYTKAGLLDLTLNVVVKYASLTLISKDISKSQAAIFNYNVSGIFKSSNPAIKLCNRSNFV